MSEDVTREECDHCGGRHPADKCWMRGRVTREDVTPEVLDRLEAMLEEARPNRAVLITEAVGALPALIAAARQVRAAEETLRLMTQHASRVEEIGQRWRQAHEETAARLSIAITRVERARTERDEARGENPRGFWSQREWEDWSNEVADLLPEEYDDDIAQEAIVLHAVADLRQRAERAEAALADLVRLKDGPRDDAYRAEKDAAWEAARTALSVSPE